jgi:MFS family permease
LVSYLQLYSMTVERELTASYPQTAPIPQPDSLATTVAYSSIPAAEDTAEESQNDKTTTSPLIFLACVGFLAAAGEGAVVTWVTIWFTRSFTSAPEGLYSIGFTCFMSSMALGRFCCDALRQLIGRRTMFKCAGLLACGGVCIIALAPSTLPEPSSLYVACFGCIVTGLGLSTLIPTVFSSAGHLPNVHPGTAISRVAFWTYAGSIVSPPLIGALSDAFESLQLGFIVLAALLFLITPLGSRVPPEPQSRAGGNKVNLEAITTPLLPEM